MCDIQTIGKAAVIVASEQVIIPTIVIIHELHKKAYILWICLEDAPAYV